MGSLTYWSHSLRWHNKQLVTAGRSTLFISSRCAGKFLFRVLLFRHSAIARRRGEERALRCQHLLKPREAC